MRERDFLERAIELAVAHSVDGVNGPFGAVITCGDRIAAEGWNRVVELADPTAHAEIVALRAACRELERVELADCTLYSSCKPCPMCLAAAYWARIPRVVFAATAQEAEKAGFIDRYLYAEFRRSDENKAIELVHRPLADAGEPFKRWLQNPMRQVY
ncbi:nucleoside deaminase [candidate division KSB1 bacterium]|nr:nucleoside deaminase [candidate division KSB1 bacterium]